VSLTGDGLAHVDKLHWHAQHEGHMIFRNKLKPTKSVMAIIPKSSWGIWDCARIPRLPAAK
jgi:hypothetical protein